MEGIHELILPARVRRDLERWSRAARPAEACGVLVGRTALPRARVTRALLGRNLCAEPGNFELDPGALVRAEDAARASGLEVVGVWHSHVDAPCLPSDEDRAGAWPGWWHVIVSTGADGSSDVRAWRPHDGRLDAPERARS